MHRLVQAVLRDGMEQLVQQQWAERAIRAVHATLPAVEHSNWPAWERIVAHAQICAELQARYDLQFPVATRLMQQTGWYLRERARYPEAQPLLEQAYALSLRLQGPEHLDTARDANTLAYLYKIQGKYGQAEPLYQRALAIREQQVGEMHLYTASSLNNLAALYYQQGKYDAAEPLFKRALAIREQQLGETHPDTAQSLNNLASLYQDQGKYKETEPLYQRALAIYTKVFGPQHPGTKTIQRNYDAFLKEKQRKQR
jgi:tetratricopeptide (TPR) repeat protein